MSVRAVVALVAVILTFAACDDGGAEDAEEVPVYITASEEMLVLGAALGNPEQEFSRVVGARLLGDSAVLVASAGTHDLRVFDMGGALLKTFGREGEGPGENRGLGELFLRGDTIITFDVLLNRVDLWSTSGVYMSSHDLPSSGDLPLWTALGVFGDGRLLGGTTPRALTNAAGTTDQYMVVARWERDSGATIPLDTLFWNQTFRVVEPNGTTGYPNPLSAGASVVVDDDHYWYTDGRSPRVEQFVSSGGQGTAVELPFAPDPVTAEDRERFEADWLPNVSGSALRRRDQVVEEAVYPETLPAVTNLVLGRDRSVWAGRYVRDGEAVRSWYVIGDDGGTVRRAELPAELRLFDATGDRVLGVRRDENGVEQVVLHALVES